MIKDFILEYTYTLSRGELFVYLALAFIFGWTVRALRSHSWWYRFHQYHVLQNMPHRNNTYVEYVPELAVSKPVTQTRDNYVPYFKNHKQIEEVKESWDDLTLIEGIGPKIASVLVRAGITTFKKLTDTPLRELNNVLESSGISTDLHNPGTWGSQAYLALNQKWDELQRIKDELIHGRNPGL